jgi:pyruvate-formate lyase-activating enzyme
MIKQGFSQGKCRVSDNSGTGPACEKTFKTINKIPHRLFTSIHLSRPEHYLSMYQSGCNMDCLKCHSWTFSQRKEGIWYSSDDIFKKIEEYSQSITYTEPRDRATSYHAHDLCSGCGECVEFTISGGKNGEKGFRLKPSGTKSDSCPDMLAPHQIVLSPQGYGPARNIVAFTGGDLGCRPEFYAQCAQKIKEKRLPVHLLFETNGFGLTAKNLDILQSSGVDSFWLDIKAFKPEVHKKLTGVTNERILRLPEEMLKRGFVLEVLTVYIPGWVEDDQIGDIAKIIAQADQKIPFTILAFFPEYKLRDVASPNLEQMLQAYDRAIESGLKQVRLGNLGVFIKNNQDLLILRQKTNQWC